MGQREIEESVNQFTDYLSTQIALIDGLQTTAERQHNGLYKKVLFVALLDSMSRAVFPSKGNRERFVGLLKNFSEWKEGDRVSLPHLVQLLAKAPDPHFSKLRVLAHLKLDEWGPSEIVMLDRDPTFDELCKLWPTEKEHRFPLAGVELESLQHWHLAYTYRNSLVHEFRTLGRGPELREIGSPHYISYTMLDDSRTWELVYPADFIRCVCATCLKNLKFYLLSNRLDPFSFYGFGTYWITELN
jgi:hypothetical protein